MLRVENNAHVVRLPWSLPRAFTGRYALQSGRRVLEPRWRRARMLAMQARQAEQPLVVVRDGRRALWWFIDCFYWESEGLTDEDVRALVAQRRRRVEQRLRSAHSQLAAAEAGRMARAPIPAELRRAVYARDGGCCVECESAFDLQYDHVLPLALGGATTLENLQLLCADCNRRKGDDL